MTNFNCFGVVNSFSQNCFGVNLLMFFGVSKM
jgi:hypothetical protein